jgi:hypothetical protein
MTTGFREVDPRLIWPVADHGSARLSEQKTGRRDISRALRTRSVIREPRPTKLAVPIAFIPLPALTAFPWPTNPFWDPGEPE